MDDCSMANINYYDINVNFSTGELVSVETNNTYVTNLLEHLNRTHSINVTLLPESLHYTITIVVYNTEGMSSQSTTQSFGIKMHNTVTYLTSVYLVVSYILLLHTYIHTYIIPP